MRVLVVEDNKVIADSVRLMLQMDAFAVDHTKLGREATTLAAKAHYDIILLDLALPDINGHKVLENLRNAGRRHMDY